MTKIKVGDAVQLPGLCDEFGIPRYGRVILIVDIYCKVRLFNKEQKKTQDTFYLKEIEDCQQEDK